MKTVRAVAAGFAVSFAGSLPLGYLNIVSFSLYRTSRDAAAEFITGVCVVEALVVYLTLRFAEKLVQRRRLLKLIDVFSVFFLLAVAVLVWLQMHGGGASHFRLPNLATPFWAGVSLSALNLAQWPFWIGWNVYLSRENYVAPAGNARTHFLLAAVVGTFAGMWAFVIGLDHLAGKFQHLTQILTLLLPPAFLALALFQGWKVAQKYGFGPKRKLFAIFRR